MNSLFKVNGKDFFSIGGQVNNSTSYSLEKIDYACKIAKEMKYNTIAIPAYWELFEPEEGIFDVRQVNWIIDSVTKYDINLVILWFGTWKNGNSHYVPKWVKKDTKRFIWAKGSDGIPVATLSPHCENTKNSDKKAFVEFCKHIKKYDTQKKVIAVQVENEPGIMGSSRDYSLSVTELLKSNVPDEVIKLYNKNGTWEEVFGYDAGEFFTTYTIAKYIDEIAKAGKEELDLPMYTNVWLGEMHARVAGIDYPSGGGVCKTLGLFRLCAKNLETISPDIYLQDRDTWDILNKHYGDGEQPYYIPEMIPTDLAITNAINSIANYGLCGVHYFAMDMFISPDGVKLPLVKDAMDGAEIISNSVHLIEKYQGTGKLYAVGQYEGASEQYIDFEDYAGSVRFTNTNGDLLARKTVLSMDNRHFADPTTKSRGKGFIVYEGDGVFYLTGNNYRLMLFPKGRIENATGAAHSADHLNTRTQPFLSVSEGYFDEAGNYITTNQRNGDEVDVGFWVTTDVKVVKLEMNTNFFD